MKVLIIVLFLIYILHLSAIIINIPEDQPTIQAGIDASVDADTVLVQPGTYYENINFNGKNITLGSLFLTTQDTTFISQTIIDGNQNGSVITFESGEDSTAVLNGFTIQNGTGGGWPSYIGGGGITCHNNSNPLLLNLSVKNNFGSHGGGFQIIDFDKMRQNYNLPNKHTEDGKFIIENIIKEAFDSGCIDE